MKRLGIVLITLSMILSVSCSNKDTTIILNEDTSNESNLKYEITSNKIEYKIDKDQTLVPWTYSGNDLYVGIRDNKPRLNDDYYVIKDEMLKYSTDSKIIEKDKVITVTNQNAIRKLTGKYYVGLEQHDYEYLEYIFDVTGDMKIKFDPFILEEESSLKEGETLSYQPLELVGDSGYYYRITYKNRSSDGESGECIIHLYDFKNNKKYRYSKEFNSSEGGRIEFIDYSYKLNKFFGLNELGEIYELELIENEIKGKLLYKIPLKRDETFAIYNDIGRQDRIFAGSKFVYNTFGENKKIKETKVLDLESLKEITIDIKLDDDGYAQVLRLSNDLVLLNNLESGKTNDYLLVNVGLDKPETIYKLSIDKDSYIGNVIANEDGTRFAATIYTKDNKFKELIEFKIEKLG